jgi:hypothetical protein
MSGKQLAIGCCRSRERAAAFRISVFVSSSSTFSAPFIGQETAVSHDSEMKSCDRLSHAPQ